MAVKKGGESCRVDGSGGGLAEVLITEFLISNISQKRGEGNESGRADRGLSNGEAERISSRDPLRPKAMPSQILSEFHFSVDRRRRESGRESRN